MMLYSLNILFPFSLLIIDADYRLIIFAIFDFIFIIIYMKINTTIYGVPSHLCHTTYTPTEYNRPQSLKNVNYLSSPQARKDLNHQLVVR